MIGIRSLFDRIFIYGPWRPLCIQKDTRLLYGYVSLPAMTPRRFNSKSRRSGLRTAKRVSRNEPNMISMAKRILCMNIAVTAKEIDIIPTAQNQSTLLFFSTYSYACQFSFWGRGFFGSILHVLYQVKGEEGKG